MTFRRKYLRAITKAAADVDVEVDAVITVIHQIAIVHFDERIQVMLLPVRVKHIAGHLGAEEGYPEGSR